MRYFLLIFWGLCSFSGTSWADCSNPSGPAGRQMFNTTYKTMQFCDGTNWYSMKGGVKYTLDTLSCANGQVTKWNTGGSVWECASDDGGITSESDPTVLTSVKDGVSWAEVTGKPAGFADGIDNVGDIESVTTIQSCGTTSNALLYATCPVGKFRTGCTATYTYSGLHSAASALPYGASGCEGRVIPNRPTCLYVFCTQ